METTVENKKIIGHNAEELLVKLSETLSKLEKLVKDSKGLYDVNGVFPIQIDYSQLVSKVGICDRRRLRNSLNRVNHKASLLNINKLFRLIHRLGITRPESTTPTKISVPKHEEIQLKRKKMLELRYQYEQALNEYKTEKGDFYKVNKF